MRRKIVQQGSSSLTISLPSEWTKKFGLVNGDMVEVAKRGEALEVTTLFDQHQKAKINLRGFDFSFSLAQIHTHYILGTKYLEVIYDKSQHTKLKELNNKYIGFKITNDSNNTLTFEEISSMNQDQFKDIFKKTIALIKDLLTSISKYEKNINFKLDNFNSFLYYCQRFVNSQIILNKLDDLNINKILENIDTIINIIISENKAHQATLAKQTLSNLNNVSNPQNIKPLKHKLIEDKILTISTLSNTLDKLLN